MDWWAPSLYANLGYGCLAVSLGLVLLASYLCYRLQHRPPVVPLLPV